MEISRDYSLYHANEILTRQIVRYGVLCMCNVIVWHVSLQGIVCSSWKLGEKHANLYTCGLSYLRLFNFWSKFESSISWLELHLLLIYILQVLFFQFSFKQKLIKDTKILTTFSEILVDSMKVNSCDKPYYNHNF